MTTHQNAHSPQIPSLTLLGKPVHFLTVSGIVSDQRRLTHTHVWSSGGGGTVTNGSGYIAAPTIHSSSEIQQDIWLQLDEKTAIPLTFHGSNVPVAEGQQLTVVIASHTPNDSAGVPLRCYNHTSQRWYDTNYPSAFVHNPSFLAQQWPLLVMFGGAYGLLKSSLLSSHPGAAAVSFIAILLLAHRAQFWPEQNRVARLARHIQSHLN